MFGGRGRAISAQQRPSVLDDYARGAPEAAVELDAGWNMHDDSYSAHQTVSSVLGVRYASSKSLDLALELPFKFEDVANNTEPSVGGRALFSGNPFAALYHVDRSDQDFTRVGVGLALPLSGAGFGNDGIAEEGQEDALAQRGAWNVWMWFPNALSLVLPARVEHRSDALVLGADLALAISVGGGVIVPSGQIALMAAARLGDISIGSRVQVMWSPVLEDRHGNVQAALVPFVQAELAGGAAFADARFVVNLDSPYGVFGDDPRWGVLLGGGTRF
jgi:hypothetical protein